MRNGIIQIPFNLQCGLVIAITCNLGKQGVCNILPPRTCRHKSAFITITKQMPIGLVGNVAPTMTTRSGNSSMCNFGGADITPCSAYL